MKLVQACLCARKDRDSSFHNCGGPVKLAEACLSASNRRHVLFRVACFQSMRVYGN